MKPLSKNRLKTLHKLAQKKYRDSENLFLVSGVRAAQSVLAHNADAVVEALFSQERTELADDLLARLPGAINTFALEAKELKSLVDEKTPQGVCLVLKKPATDFSALALPADFILFLDRINDPGNLGTILRSAEWFGFNTVLLSSDSVNILHPKVVRSSAGTLLDIHIAENCSAGHLQQLKESYGYTLLASDVSEGRDIAGLSFDKPVIVMLGSEAHGLDPQYLALSNEKISIAGVGRGESLNLANAAAIIMYQAVVSNNQ